MLPRIYDYDIWRILFEEEFAEGEWENLLDQMNEKDDDNVENCVKMS